MNKFNLILTMFVMVFVAVACDYVDYRTENYLLGLVSLLCWFLAGLCLGKLTNFFGQGDKL